MSEKRSLSTDWNSYISKYGTNTKNSQYERAKELGFESTIEDFENLSTYTSQVFQLTRPPVNTPARIPQNLTFTQSMIKVRDFNVSPLPNQRLHKSTVPYNRPKFMESFVEETWVKELREKIETQLKLISETPLYDSIKRERLELGERIRQKRLEPPPLPDLPADCSARIKKALSTNQSVTLIEKFDIPITSKDLTTLRGSNWLNDEVINYYYSLIQDRSQKNPELPKIHTFSTFFYKKLKDSGFDGVKRWTRRVDLFQMDKILIPIHLGIHWCCAEIDIKSKNILYYDSLHGTNQECIELLLDYIVKEHADKKGSPLAIDDWVIDCPKNIPAQQNGYDCGVFTCCFAEYRSRNVTFTFRQKNMQYFRERMMYEILTGEMLKST